MAIVFKSVLPDNCADIVVFSPPLLNYMSIQIKRNMGNVANYKNLKSISSFNT
jgi:hypothetical protein